MWEVVEEHVRVMRECGEFEVRRRAQRKLWLWNHIDWLLMHRYMSVGGGGGGGGGRPKFQSM